MAAALDAVGCRVLGVLGRGDDTSGAARGADVLFIAVRDADIAAVARSVEPVDGCLVVHMSGSLGLDVLVPHKRRASVHPLVPLPCPEVGASRLLSGVHYAVAGDPGAAELVSLLSGKAVEVADAKRGTYHAAACIAANHLVALMGQVERVAASAGLDLAPFIDLARFSLDDVKRLGAAGALTGPAARGDAGTLQAHRRSIDASEIPAYDALSDQARRLARHVGTSSARMVTAPAGKAAPRVVTTCSEFARAMEEARQGGLSVGLVATMGALHAGHCSLVERSASECGLTAVTIFVNPLQFEDPSDLAAYPRDLQADVALAARAGAGLVFAPPVEEMYPGYPAPVATRVQVSSLSGVLEGASRPGHLDGVATVVTKLLALTGRCRAYFGEKDFQQLALVRRLVEDLSLPVEVVGCATVRQEDGLALSSRNVRLSPAERAAALVLRQALLAGRRAILGGTRDPEAVRSAMRAVLDAEPLVETDYAEVVDAVTLSRPNELRGQLRLLVAARVGPVRLIDNEGVRVLDSERHASPRPPSTRAGRMHVLRPASSVLAPGVPGAAPMQPEYVVASETDH